MPLQGHAYLKYFFYESQKLEIHSVEKVFALPDSEWRGIQYKEH
jgi:hypothetical protein